MEAPHPIVASLWLKYLVMFILVGKTIIASSVNVFLTVFIYDHFRCEKQLTLKLNDSKLKKQLVTV